MAKATERGARSEARVDTKATGGGRDATEGETKQAMSEARQQAQDKAHEVKEEAKERARDARHEAEARADHWTTSMGERADSVGRALRAAADRLRDEGETSMADMARDAASQVERMSGYLEDESPRDMLDDFEELGRKNPGAFVGSAFAVGLAAGRFLRASRSSGHDGQVERDARRVEQERTGLHSSRTRGASGLGQPEHPTTPARSERAAYPGPGAHAPEAGHPGRPT
jgi:hypothetical protein